jgi:hypothetical protein
MQHRRLLLMLPEKLRQHFSPLVEAWNEQNISVEFHEYFDNKIPGENYIGNIAKGFNALMVVGDSRFAPRSVISKPFIVLDGTKIPVAWLPVRNSGSLLKFVNAASSVQMRKRKTVAVGLLSQRLPKYLQVADKMENELKRQSAKNKSFRWTSELVYPEDMLNGVNCGIGAAIYIGHGRPVGWAGYFGIRMHHLIDFINEPAGAIISLCCHTASRRNVGISFSENLVMEGVSASAFGATQSTLFSDNTRWAVNICKSLSKGVTTIGELVVDAAPMSPSSVNSYRLIGDPFAPLFSTPESLRIAKRIKTYR